MYHLSSQNIINLIYLTAKWVACLNRSLSLHMRIIHQTIEANNLNSANNAKFCHCIAHSYFTPLAQMYYVGHIYPFLHIYSNPYFHSLCGNGLHFVTFTVYMAN